MKINNSLAIFLTIIFTLTLLPCSVGALSYRTDLNNGSWAGYLPNIPTSSFENDFNSGRVDSNQIYCVDGWCVYGQDCSSTTNDSISRSSAYSILGTYSLNVKTSGCNNNGYNKTTFVYTQDAFLVDTNVSFWIKMSTNYNNSSGFGYWDGAGRSYSDMSLDGALYDSGFVGYKSIVIPAGQKFSFFIFNNANIYIDDVKFNGISYSNFLTPDSQFSAKNRGFETTFNNDVLTANGSACSQGWCNISTTQTENFSNKFVHTSTNYARTGSNSLYMHGGGGISNSFQSGSVMAYSQTEIATESLVTFYYNQSSIGAGGGGYSAPYFSYGYVDDSNNYTSMGNLANGVTSWTKVSYLVPSGNYKIAFKLGMDWSWAYSTSADAGAYIDDISITRNNVGTFYKGVDAISCYSIANCSNVTSASALKSNDTRDLFWYVDYVSGASCNVYENGVSQGLMGTFNNGMYVYRIQDKAYPSNDTNVLLNASCTKSSYDDKSFIVYPQIFNDSNIQTTMSVGNTATDNLAERGDLVTFWTKYYDDLGSQITTATCTLTIDGATNSMIYNSSNGRYEYSKGFVTDNTYPTIHACSKGNYLSQLSSYDFIVGEPPAPLVENVTFTNISNAIYSINDSNIQINNNNFEDIIFSMVALENGSAKVVWNNFNRLKNYLVYTSSDGVNWVFNDSLTFGSTAYNGLQKIYYSNTYNWSFEDIVSTTKKYYKLEIQEPELSWATIKNSDDWIKVSPPSEYSDFNSIKWDLFNNSNISPLQFYSKNNFPTLTSSTLTGSFIVRFTAYAEDINSTATLQYGVVGGSLSDLTLSGTPQTFNVNISANESQLLIKGKSSENYAVYISDITIIPRAYFIDVTNVFSANGGVLPSIVINHVSSQYVQETTPFLMKTRAYNTSGLVKSVRTDVFYYTDSNALIKSYSWDVSNTRANSTITLNKLIDGVIAYLISDSNSLVSLPQIYIKNTLLDADGRSVAEQTSNFGFLQYPYFANDIVISMNNLKSKVGQSPEFDFRIQQKNVNAFIGVEFSVYDYSTPLESDTPLFSKIIYAKDLKCFSLSDCTKKITLSEYSFEWAGNYSILANVILTTQEPNSIWNYSAPAHYLNQPLRSAFLMKVYPSYTGLETARILQVFERTNKIYKTTEPVPLVFQARNDELTNMSDEYLVELTSQDDSFIDSSISYQPSKFIYDEVTGYNYWYFNYVFTDTAGGVLDTGDQLAPLVKLTSLKQTIDADYNTFGLSDKCTGYPADLDYFWAGSFIQSWLGLDPRYKCQVDAPFVVNGVGEYIDFNSDYVPSALQNHSLICVNADWNKKLDVVLGTEVICSVWYRKSEEQIDKFSIIIGNEFSNYSKRGDEIQYIKFEIPQEQIMFNDVTMLKASLDASYSTDRIDTAGELFFAQLNKIAPYFNGTYEDFINNLYAGVNTGYDINVSEMLNPNVVSGVFFFKIKGLGVVNQNDYVKDYEQLAYYDASDFRTFALENNISLPKREALVQIYSSDSKVYSAFKINSPLIIFEQPSTKANDDINAVVVPVKLKFNFIADMVSANFTKISRSYVPLVFTFKVPNAPFSLADLFKGVDAFISNPVESVGGFAVTNWFLILILGAGILIGSVVYLNFKVARK